MTSNELLNALKTFTEDAVKDLLLPVRFQKSDEEPPEDRAPLVFQMRLPDYKSATKKAPYILHQKVTSKDSQEPGQRSTSEAVIRTVFCVYDEDEQQGGLSLNEVMDRVRIPLLRQRILAGQFELLMDGDHAPQSLVYTEETAPYYIGEMVTTWRLPPIEREVKLYEPYENFFGQEEGSPGL